MVHAEKRQGWDSEAAQGEAKREAQGKRAAMATQKQRGEGARGEAEREAQERQQRREAEHTQKQRGEGAQRETERAEKQQRRGGSTEAGGGRAHREAEEGGSRTGEDRTYGLRMSDWLTQSTSKTETEDTYGGACLVARLTTKADTEDCRVLIYPSC